MTSFINLAQANRNAREHMKLMRRARAYARPEFREMYAAYRRGVGQGYRNQYTGASGNSFARAMNAIAEKTRGNANNARVNKYNAEKRALGTSRKNTKDKIKALLKKPIVNWQPDDFKILKTVGKARFMNTINRIEAINIATVPGMNRNTRINMALINGNTTGLSRLGRMRASIRAQRERAQNFSVRFRRGVQKRRNQLAEFGRRRAANLGRAYGSASRAAGRFYGAAYGAGHALGNYPRSWARARQYGTSASPMNQASKNREKARLKEAVNQARLAAALHPPRLRP